MGLSFYDILDFRGFIFLQFCLSVFHFGVTFVSGFVGWWVCHRISLILRIV